MRQRERRIPLPDGGKLRCHVRQTMSHEMHHLAVALDASPDREHARTQDDAAVFLEDLRPDDEVGDPAALGGVLETFVHNELLKSLPHQQSHWRLYHWRHQRGREIDILAETNRTIVGFEMKASANVDLYDFRHLQRFRTDGPGSAWNVIGIVIYLGDRPLTFGSKLFALPLSSFWSFAAD